MLIRAFGSPSAKMETSSLTAPKPLPSSVNAPVPTTVQLMSVQRILELVSDEEREDD